MASSNYITKTKAIVALTIDDLKDEEEIIDMKIYQRKKAREKYGKKPAAYNQDYKTDQLVISLSEKCKKSLMKLRQHVQHSVFGKIESRLLLFNMISVPFISYQEGVMNTRKRKYAVCQIIFSLLMTLRFTYLTFCNEPRVWELLGDTFYLIRFRVFANLAFAMICLMTASFSLSYYLGESNRYLSFTEIFIKINQNQKKKKNGKDDTSGNIGLHKKYHAKFCSKVRALYYLIYMNVIWSTIVFGGAMLSFLALLALQQEEYHFHPLVLLFWVVIILIYGVLSAVIGVSQVLLFYISSLYISYRYKQINEKMYFLSRPKPNTKSKWLNVKQVMSFIKEHNQITEYTHRENKWWKYYLLLMYVFITPFIDLFFYVAFFAPIPLLMRVVAAILSIEVCYMVLFITNKASRISKLAHDPYQTLNSLFVHQRCALRMRIKLVWSIERFSGPVIGFYCGDLFPFTSDTFKEYIASVAVFFFLILELVIKYLPSEFGSELFVNE